MLRQLLLAIAGGFIFFFCVSPLGATNERENLSRGLSHYIMGLLYDFDGDAEKAVEQYREAAKHDYTSYAVHLRIGADYARLGKLDEAVHALNLAAQFNPEDLQSHYLLALIYSSQQEFSKAANEYEVILKHYKTLDPENTQVYKYLAQLYYSQNKFDKAIEQYNSILSYEPKNAEVIYLMGSVYLDINDRPKATELFKQALTIDPEHEGSLNSLGYMYAEDGVNLDEAMDLIQRAIKINPDNGAYLDSLGWIYYKKGLLQESLSELIRASQKLEDPIIYDHLGDVYYHLKKKDDALKYWDLSLKLLPDQERIIKKVENVKSGKELNP